MGTFIALLRGINVGGNKKIRMADLRQYLEASGLEAVKTYIQSGNIVFKSKLGDTRKLEEQIFQVIKSNYPFEARVMVLSLEEWQEAFEQNPFLPEKEEEIKALHLTYFSSKPDWEQAGLPEQLEWGDNHYISSGRRMYLYLPNGMSKSGLEKVFPERKFKVLITTRNWKTVSKILEMAREL